MRLRFFFNSFVLWNFIYVCLWLFLAENRGLVRGQVDPATTTIPSTSAAATAGEDPVHAHDHGSSSSSGSRTEDQVGVSSYPFIIISHHIHIYQYWLLFLSPSFFSFLFLLYNMVISFLRVKSQRMKWWQRYIAYCILYIAYCLFYIRLPNT